LTGNSPLPARDRLRVSIIIPPPPVSVKVKKIAGGGVVLMRVLPVKY